MDVLYRVQGMRLSDAPRARNLIGGGEGELRSCAVVEVFAKPVIAFGAPYAILYSSA